MPRFEEAITGTLEVLKQRGRVSYAAITRQYGLSPDDLEALKDELTEILGAARDEGGRMLVAVAEAAPREGAPERRLVSVMACDLVASTPLSRRLDPEQLREVIRSYQASVEAAIKRHGGHAARWQGDGVMVYFGYPRAEEDDALRAVRCGWEIMRDLAEVRERITARYDVTIQARVGVHCGTVVVGDDGIAGWQAFGETPNVAARVESVSAPDDVTVTSAIKDFVGGHFDLEPLGPHELKGVEEPMELFRVVAPRANVARFEAERAARLVPLVDRESERGILGAAADRARAGERAAVLLTGEAGIGKSRLIHHLVHRFAADLQPLHLQCRQYGGASPLHPLVDALHEHWALTGDAAERRRSVEHALAGHQSLGPLRVELFGGLLGIATPGGEAEALSPQRRRAMTLDALAGWIAAEARRTPMLLVVEDLHWADPSTRELIGRLLEAPESVPLLFVITSRSPETEIAAHARALALERLGPEDARELVRSATDQALDPALVDQITAQADGVPLFVEEMTRTLVATGENGIEGVVPATLYGCLMARLDRDPDAREVAQAAAAIGRRFDTDLLGRLTELGPEELRARLDTLVADDLLVEQRADAGVSAYVFRHALIREAARNSLLRARHQELHSKIADLLVQRPRVAEEQPEVLAGHLEAAERFAEAITFRLAAALQALQGSSYQEADLHLGRAISLAGRMPEGPERDGLELSARVLAGVTLTATRGWTDPEVEAHFQRAREIGARVGDVPQLFPALSGLLSYLIVSGQFAAAEEMGRANLELAISTGDPGLELEAEVELGNILMYVGRLEEALAHLDRVAELYDPARHRHHAFVFGKDPFAITRVQAALALFALGRPDTAQASIEQGLAHLERFPHPFSEGWVRLGAAIVHGLRGEIAASREFAEAGVAQATIEGFPQWVAQGRVYIGWARVAQGAHDAGLEEIRGGLEMWRMGGAQLLLPWLLGQYGEACLRADLPETAIEAVNEGRRLAEENGERWCEPELLRVLGLAELAVGGSREDAAERVREAAELAAERGHTGFELRAAIALVELGEDDGRLRRVAGAMGEGVGTADVAAANALLHERTTR
jgi:class 3 adenylate cyclase/tetratricopeptide (TPR) repeat protein